MLTADRMTADTDGDYSMYGIQICTTSTNTQYSLDIMCPKLEPWENGSPVWTPAVEDVTNDNREELSSYIQTVSLDGYSLGKLNDNVEQLKWVSDTEEWSLYQELSTAVFDGTENWQYEGINDVGLASFYLPLDNTSNGADAVCTHFDYQVEDTTDMVSHGFRIGDNAIRIRKGYIYNGPDDPLPTSYIDDFKQWLADEYTSGTPVKVVYQLTTAGYVTLPNDLQQRLTEVIKQSDDTTILYMVSDGISYVRLTSNGDVLM